jgi:hypothetical protein
MKQNTRRNSIYTGHSESAHAMWKLDSSCDAGDTYIDEGAGAMLLVVEGSAYESITLSAKLDVLGCAAAERAMQEKNLTSNGKYWNTGQSGPDEDTLHFKSEMPHCMAGCGLDECEDASGWTDSRGHSCQDYETEEWCIDGRPHPEMRDENMDSAAQNCCVCGGGKGKCGDQVCEMSLDWVNITAMSKVGKAFTGGLGHKSERSNRGHYGVWVCVRDWFPDEMRKCGVGPGQLACFRFEERSREFHSYGKNDDVKLVSPEAMHHGFFKEEAMISMLPRSHHDPAPFLT